jgi:protein-tyrosine phosphatase
MAPLVIDVRSAEDSRDVVHRAVQALAEGKLVVFPTETVYALAASALNEAAIAQLLAVKRRGDEAKPLTLAVKSADDALDYLPRMNRLALRLARRCWPGPVTLVCPDNHPESVVKQLPGSVQKAVAPEGLVGLRVPGHETFLDVLRMLAGPVAMTSANRTGEPEPYSAQQVVSALGDEVALVLDDGRSRFGQASSVVKVDQQGFELLRSGVVSEQTLRRLSSFYILFVCTGNTCRSPMAEAICRKLLADRLGCKVDELEEKGVSVMSAGLSAYLGGRPAAEAVEVMQSIGVELTQHERQQLTAQLVRHELLCLDQRDVPDPIGGPVEQYQQCAGQIKAELEGRLKHIEI